MSFQPEIHCGNSINTRYSLPLSHLLSIFCVCIYFKENFFQKLSLCLIDSMTFIDFRKKKVLYLSLKWKVVLGISLVLIIVNVAVTLVTYDQIVSQFEQNRLLTQQSHKRGFDGLLKNSFDRMKQLSYLIPVLKINDFLSKDSFSLTKNSAEGSHSVTTDPAEGSYLSQSRGSFAHQLKMVLERHASLLQIEYSLNSIYYFQNIEQPVVTWNPAKLPETVKLMVRDSLKTEQPGSLLACREQCNLYTATPLLHENGEMGVLLLSASLVELVVEFASISNADIGLITRANKTAREFDKDLMLLKNWSAKLLVLSNAKQHRLLLENFSQHYSLRQALDDVQQMKWHDNFYEVQLIPLNEMTQEQTTMALVISDISQELAAINATALKTFYTGLLGLLVSEVMLFAILWFPMREISRVVDALPLFAQNAYSRIREQLHNTEKMTLVDDEIDLLSDSVVDLSLQLEDLQRQVDIKNSGLMERSNELAKEKEFITGLLNTTQAIILTQDIHGNIQMLNSKGWSLIAYESNGIVGTPFNDVLLKNELKREVVARLKEIRLGDREHYHHEAEINCATKSRCIISWYHSLLSIRGNDGAVMLSVGLDITERKVAEEQLEWIADHDPLTGLHNRRRFQKDLGHILSIARQYEQSGALLYFDVDHFKYLNDSQGHQAGDRMLQMISEKLKTTLKRPDILARLGGDEFAVVLTKADEKIAVKVAQRIIDNVRSINSNVLGGAHKISVSIGIVLFPNDGFNIPDLMSNVDLAMYQAKEKKRGSYHLYSSNDQFRERVNQLMVRKERIETAITEDRFVLYFQPIMNIATGEIQRYETLIRMMEEDGTIQLPGTFIPEAEQLGLIDEIDQLVMGKAIQALGDFLSEGYDLSLSVNLSGKAMDNPDILVLIQEQLRQYNVDPSRLIIEVTETAAVSDIVGAERLMREIKDLGCRFALDDFGVGFSSFFYLKQLPVDYVKLDGMFIRQLPYSDEDQIFVKALNEMAHGLGKQTVAEFVENDKILEMLKNYGVDYAQGYYIGKPQPDILRDQGCRELKM